MENYIMLDGKKFEIEEPLVELLRGVVSEKKEESPFAQIYDKPYYFITSCGDIDVNNDSNSFTDDNRYKAANYCADKEIMRQRALHETLNRLLWRFSEENDGDNDWDGNADHYVIYYHGDKKCYNVAKCNCVSYQGAIYFSSKEFANRAIDEIVKPFMAEHPDFVW